MLFLRNVSVTMKRSIFSLCISSSSREHAFLLVEFTFLREQTFKTAMVGRRMSFCLLIRMLDLFFGLVGLMLSGDRDSVVCSHVWGGGELPQLVR